ncbi:protein FAM83G [Malaclemys terrapin pileata]|uniref:protein FAM83G n=1 Tax=Malaclemys terrapin pileata TaxID=2991368 RepID=UPI0023A90AAC|nr:protein FAM83G [Malaclemys terrapin pileata]
MALSQVQCLDDSHVNWRSSESKPEFFYSEEQRLALEALVSKGPEAFYEVLKKENIRDFLSELELKKIMESLETYDPGSEYIPRHGGGDSDGDCTSQVGEGELAPSLEYWPQRSDRSIPQLDLGWPETAAYRGVTRAVVYMQPPIDGQTHIKEVVRKMIVQAQKVVAVVMDMFTDVDIFKDLLEAGFKRKVGVYIIVDETNVKYFLQMCERAQMHTGHLKNLRVRTTGGTEFFTRSATRFKGALAQKFMFVDGDRAMCGSYSFTWSAARTDRNLISVLSGQVVEAFDKQFQELYLMSRGLSLKSIPMDEEPEPEPFTLPSVTPVAPANAVVKRLINPKYALVKAKSAELISKMSSDRQAGASRNKMMDSKDKALPEGQGAERQNDMADLAPPIHPGLLNMEKANMFDYLPTWVEPDPDPSEILGYINIIDPTIKNVKLSQMNRIKVCDISQANAQHRQMLKNKESEAKKSQEPSPASREQREAPPTPIKEPPKPVESPKARSPGEDKKGALAILAVSQHLKQPTAAETHKMDVKPPVPRPRTVDVVDFISKTSALCRDTAALLGDAKRQLHQVAEQANADHGPGENPTQAQAAASDHRLRRQAAVSPEAQGTAAVCPVNGLEGEEDEEDYLTLSDQESYSSSSATHSYHHSNASSTSDELFEVRGRFGPLRRTNSDHIPNGGNLHLQRKMSDPHVSRGTYVSPLGSLQSPPNLRLEDGVQRRDDVTEVIRCVLEKGNSLRAVLDGKGAVASKAGQGQPFHHYVSRNSACPGQGKGGIHAPRHEKNPGLSKYKADGTSAKKPIAATSSPPYWQSKGFSSIRNMQPGQGLHRATGKPLSSLPESQRTADEVRTPLGIPLTKLSQSKHLKTRAGGGQQVSTDSKRRLPGATSRKDQ